MKNLLILLFLVLTFCMPANAYTIKGGVEYTVDTARVVAFDNTDMQISKEEYTDYLTNLFNLSDMAYIRSGILRAGIGSFTDRRLVPFYKNNKLAFYGVQYDDIPNKKFYYSTNGKLLKFDICQNPDAYPYKALSYDNQGRLITAHLAVSEKESFVFDKNKNLIGHWINNQFYDKDGKKGISRHL